MQQDQCLLQVKRNFVLEVVYQVVRGDLALTGQVQESGVEVCELVASFYV